MAPERFYSRNRPTFDDADLCKHDMFSLGYSLFFLLRYLLTRPRCVIAEIWLEGQALFTYSTLLSYKKGVFDPSTLLSKIENEDVVRLIRKLITIDPQSRPEILTEFSNWYAWLTDFLHTAPHIWLGKQTSSPLTLSSCTSTRHPSQC